MPPAGPPASTSRTSPTSRRASCSAMLAPTMPAPTTTTSASMALPRYRRSGRPPWPTGSAGVEGQQVILGLPADQHPGGPVADGDDLWPGHVVVLAGHAPAVRPGTGHGEQVTGREVGGQELVLDHDVAALAMLAHHPGQDRRGRRRAR